MLREINARRLELLTRRKLLPPDLEEKRLEAPVVKLASKGYPEGYFKNADGKDGVSSLFSAESFDKSEINGRAGLDRGIIMMRKAFPHGMYGLMLVKAGVKDKVAISDFDSKDRYSFYKTAEEFAYFCESQGIYPNISWTYDPETRDRKSGQSQLWYHMHLNSHTSEERQRILEGRKELKNVKGKETKRAFIDEFSVVSSMVLKDYFNGHKLIKTGNVVGPFEHDGLPNFGVEMTKGWEQILSKDFDEDMNNIHEAILKIFNLIKSKIFHHGSGKWERPIRSGIKIDRNEFPWMTESTVEALNTFLENLAPDLFKTHVDFFRNNPKSKLTSHLYPLAGASYCTTITKVEGGKLLLSIRPQMFSDTGAAGLHYAFGTTVKVERGSEIYSDQELDSKERFENGFADFLKLANFKRS